MDKPMSDCHFKFMAFGYKFRDGFLPRRNILDEVGIKEGFHKGILSFSDHHMKEKEIVSKLTDKGLFRLSSKGKRTCSFLKECLA